MADDCVEAGVGVDSDDVTSVVGAGDFKTGLPIPVTRGSRSPVDPRPESPASAQATAKDTSAIPTMINRRRLINILPADANPIRGTCPRIVPFPATDNPSTGSGTK